MTKERLNQIQEELIDIARNKQLINVVSTNKDGYSYNWLISNNSVYLCDKSMRIENIDDAVEIIHNFSLHNKNFIKSNLEQQNFKDDEILYLHFTKQPNVFLDNL